MNFNPDSWMDIAAYAIVGLPAILAAWAALRGHRKTSDHQDTIERTLYEVTNNHDTNLRDDIDDIARLVRDGFADIRKDIGGLREELRTERIERIEGDRRPAA